MLCKGQKFTSRNLEVALPATISFDGKGELEDPFFVENNSCIRIRFKLLGDTLSGTIIDPSVTIFPNVKAQLSIEREVIAEDYVIWNSIGKSLRTL
jgi:hypothetical protein